MHSLLTQKRARNLHVNLTVIKCAEKLMLFCSSNSSMRYMSLRSLQDLLRSIRYPEGETTWRVMVAWQRSLSENCTAAFAICRAMHRATVGHALGTAQCDKVQCDMGLQIVVLPGSKVVVGMRKYRKGVRICSVCCIQLVLCGDLLTS
jgi:hypothetical protein